MLDRRLRRLTAPALDNIGGRLAAAGLPAGAVTGAGWLVGVGACAAAATRQWPAALVLWLANRALDGLDGPVARARGATDRGGYLDIVADFSIYGGFVAAVAVAVPAARLACVALLVAYYVSGTALLALSSILERRRHHQDDDPRSIRFAGGLAEGTETIIAYSLFCLIPHSAPTVAWAFAAAVAVTAAQRVATGIRVLSAKPPHAANSDSGSP